MFKSRKISFFLAVAVAATITIFLYLFDITSADRLLFVFGISLVLAFTCFLITLEFFIYKDLRKLNKLFDTKEQEIDKLKKLESFRREFLADISHELKTPVFAAQGFIHTLLDGAIDDKSVRKKFLKKAGKSLDRLNLLVQDLIIISQMETGEIVMQNDDFDLYILTEDIVEQLETRLKKKQIDLAIKGTVGEYIVKADYYRINQVLTNLIENAIKYGDSPGEIVVGFSRVGNKIKVMIQDDGPGIPEEHQSRIFQRFYRIDKSRSRVKGGTGLGLAIVKHIIEAHNSNIVLRSKPGEGTVFTFLLNSSEQIK